MSILSLFSAAGLLGLASGVLLVNAAESPRSAQFGSITAGVGVLMLAIAAAGQLISRG